MNIQEKEQIEIDFWKNSLHENQDNFSIYNIVNKLSEAKVFLEKIEKYKQFFVASSTILEIGAGQGWASCILKKLFTDKKIITSDISEHAIASIKHWESLFGVAVDQKVVCKSYSIPLQDNSVDMVFCFQSAHHFVKHKETLAEIHRVLKSGGYALYLHEPSCRKYIYTLARKRVNAKRPNVPEDVLVYKEIVNFSKETGFDKANLMFAPTLLNRGPLETIYFYILKKLPFLQHLLPTSIDYLFKK